MFKDVFMAFTQKEWKQLEPAQRNLSMENQDPKQGMISKLEKEEEPSLEEAKTTSPHSVSKIARPKKSGANEKVQQDDDHIEEKQKSRGKLIEEATLKKKNSTSKKSSACALLEKKKSQYKTCSFKKKASKIRFTWKELKAEFRFTWSD